jgi:hypothetical protein
MRVVKSPRTQQPSYLKVAYCIGYTAYYVHEFLISIWFKILVALAATYGIIRLTGISIEIIQAGSVLLNIR